MKMQLHYWVLKVNFFQNSVHSFNLIFGWSLFLNGTVGSLLPFPSISSNGSQVLCVLTETGDHDK